MPTYFRVKSLYIIKGDDKMKGDIKKKREKETKREGRGRPDIEEDLRHALKG